MQEGIAIRIVLKIMDKVKILSIPLGYDQHDRIITVFRKAGWHARLNWRDKVISFQSTKLQLGQFSTCQAATIIGLLTCPELQGETATGQACVIQVIDAISIQGDDITVP